eukprot:2473788-Pleurochrysis_carterae.AAC.5
MTAPNEGTYLWMTNREDGISRPALLAFHKQTLSGFMLINRFSMSGNIGKHYSTARAARAAFKFAAYRYTVLSFAS